MQYCTGADVLFSEKNNKLLRLNRFNADTDPPIPLATADLPAPLLHNFLARLWHCEIEHAIIDCHVFANLKQFNFTK